MRKKRLLVATLVAGGAAAAILVANSFGAGGNGAVANFTPGSVKIQHSSNTAPAPAWSTVGTVTLPVGSWVVSAHTVVTLASTAPTGTDVECYLVAPNSQLGYTATGLFPSKASNLRELSAQTVSDAPNGGTASLVCRVNSREDNKLAFAKQTSLIATSVEGTSTSLNNV
jgi:hypothetical protein